MCEFNISLYSALDNLKPHKFDIVSEPVRRCSDLLYATYKILTFITNRTQ